MGRWSLAGLVASRLLGVSVTMEAKLGRMATPKGKSIMTKEKTGLRRP